MIGERQQGHRRLASPVESRHRAARAEADRLALTQASAAGVAAANALVEKWNAVLAASKPLQKVTARADH